MSRLYGATRVLTTGLVALAMVVSACSTTKKGEGAGMAPAGLGPDGGVQGRGLDAFAPIPGDEDGARTSDRVFFTLDSAVIDAESRQTLTRQAEWLKRNPDRKIVLEGHCDERGTREYNLALGDRRAKAAQDILVQLGVPASNVSTVSYGKERPAVQGADEAAWSQNRRAVTVLDQHQ